MINYEKVSEKIFSIIKGHGYELIMFTKEGQETSTPSDARRFFCKNPNFMVTLDEENNDVKFNKNKNVTLDEIEKLLKQIKNLAQTYMLNSTVKIFGQEIMPKDYAYQAKQYKEKEKMDNVLEASLSKMHGSRKTSYQTLESVKVIVRHHKPVNEEVRGSRTRAIKEIFIERAGERFRFPHNYLAGARAMARHVYEGGKVDDVVGSYIIEQTSNLLKLKEFYRYANTNKLINEGSEDIISVVKENALSIKSELRRLQGGKTYESIKAKIEENATEIIEEQNADDLKELFTVKMFDEGIGAVLPLVKKLVNEKQAWKQRIEEASGNPFKIVRSEIISEEEVFEFSNPQQKIGYRLQGIVARVQEESELSRFVGKAAEKLAEGQELNEFEKTVVKNVLGNIQIVESEDDEDDEPSNFKDEWGRDTDEQDEWKKNVTGKKNKKVEEDGPGAKWRRGYRASGHPAGFKHPDGKIGPIGGTFTTEPHYDDEKLVPVDKYRDHGDPLQGRDKIGMSDRGDKPLLPRNKNRKIKAAIQQWSGKHGPVNKLPEEVVDEASMTPHGQQREKMKQRFAQQKQRDTLNKPGEKRKPDQEQLNIDHEKWMMGEEAGSEVPSSMHQKAAQVSKEHRCVQHIERDPETGEYRLSDWYDCDNTVASYENGRLKESIVDRMTETLDKKLAELTNIDRLFKS